MQHHHCASKAGSVTPISDEAFSPGRESEGLLDNDIEQRDFIQSTDWTQSEDFGHMAWLSQQFEKAGLHLYHMGDATLMVTSVGAGLARQLPDLRSARAFLTMMGGSVQ
jgi:hypothetical protein